MKILEVNIDDMFVGGVYSLVKRVIQNNTNKELKMDIASFEHFQKEENIKELNIYNCKIYYIGSNKGKLQKHISAYNNLKKLASNYDCVHIHSDVANRLLLFGLASKQAGVKKIILHSHASDVDGNNRTIKKLIHILTRRFLINIGTDFVACSDLAAKWMFPNIANIKIINNGVNVNEFKYSLDVRKQVRDELYIENKILLGHVGRFAYQKNHEFLIKIMRSLDLSKYKLLLIGEGPDEDKIKELIKKNGLENNVIMYGTSNRINQLMQAMDIFLLPSFFEGLPIVGVEAQTCGLPTIFSDLITKEAKLVKDVSYIPINDKDINSWIEKIEEYSKIQRRDNSDIIKSKGFDIKSTLDSFYELYLNS